jgi:CHAT domain-containing protein
LYQRAVSELSLPETELVVLAGCRTAAHGGGRGSVRSLAHAFLGSGARSVLASLWDVDDEATSALTLDFYRGVHSGQRPAAALRDAQRKAIERGSPIQDWAGFQLLVAN